MLKSKPSYTLVSQFQDKCQCELGILKSTKMHTCSSNYNPQVIEKITASYDRENMTRAEIYNCVFVLQNLLCLVNLWKVCSS